MSSAEPIATIVRRGRPGLRPLSDERLVVPVACKSGLARPAHRGAKFVHRIDSMAVVFDHGKVRLSAEWLCNWKGTESALVVANAKGFVMCPACEDRHAGPAVYRLFDRNGVLIYVGASAEVSSRLRKHELNKPWWPDVAEVRVERFADMSAAFRAEDAAIKTEDPLHNQLPGPKATKRAA